MKLTLAIHPITELRAGPNTELDGSSLQINVEELRQYLLEDQRLGTVDLEIVSPGDICRVGYVFDILEPRAKEPGSGPDFPGILSPIAPAGQGTTHVLKGAAVTVVDGGQPGGELGYTSRRGGVAKILEMSGPPSEASPYGNLRHLVVVPHAHADVPRHAVLNALRLASVKASVYLARSGIGKTPDSTQEFNLDTPSSENRSSLPRVAYIGQVHGHQHGTEVDEHILYGGNTKGMLPVTLHPNEWLDGALVISYSWGARGLETYFHQNNPIILDLYRRHQVKELTFIGVIATASSGLLDELNRNAMLAAQIAKNTMHADAAIITKYAGGAPHSDMFETARICEDMGIKTAIMVSDTAPDRRAESAALMNIPGVDAVVNVSEAADISWPAPPVETIVAGNPDVGTYLVNLTELPGVTICGVTNNQGASKLQSMIY